MARDAYIVGAAAAAVLLLAATASASGDLPPASGDFRLGPYTGRPQEQAAIFDLSMLIEDGGTLRGLHNFLLATAFIESKFNPDAERGTGPNRDIGWFQMKPKTAFNWKNDLTDLQSQPNLLKNRAWAVAAAADLVRRLMDWAEPGQRITWGDMRRGWGTHTRVPASQRDNFPEKRANFRIALEQVGVSPDFIDQEVVLGSWPGILPLAERLGAPAP